jgi:hypothetical protein
MHIVVLTATLLVLLCLPCIVAVVLCADETADRAAWVRRRRRETRALRRLDRSLRPDGPVPTPRAEACLTIEQLAADLRRLDRQRHSGVTTESAAWLAAVLRAYDERLRLASRCLGIAEHLALLNGMDREIERVRVEGELQAAGLALRSVAHRPPDRLT